METRIWFQSAVEMDGAGAYAAALQAHAANVVQPGTVVDVHGVPRGTWAAQQPSALFGFPAVFLAVLGRAFLRNAVRAEREGWLCAAGSPRSPSPLHTPVSLTDGGRQSRRGLVNGWRLSIKGPLFSVRSAPPWNPATGTTRAILRRLLLKADKGGAIRRPGPSGETSACRHYGCRSIRCAAPTRPWFAGGLCSGTGPCPHPQAVNGGGLGNFPAAVSMTSSAKRRFRISFISNHVLSMPRVLAL